MNMKVNSSGQLLKAGTGHIGFLHSLKSLLLPFLAKRELTAVSNVFPVQPWVSELTSICYLHALISTLPDRAGPFWGRIC